MEAAEAVLGSGAATPDEVVDLPDALVAKSLVVAERHGAAMRYRLLHLIREYATTRLEEAGETSTVRNVHLSWADAGACAAERAIWYGSPEQMAWFARLAEAEADLQAAFDWALQTGQCWTAATILIRLWGVDF